MCHPSQTPALRPLQSRSQSRLARSQSRNLTMMTTTMTTMMTSATMTTGSMTMTDMEQENPSPLLTHMRRQNNRLRDKIVREIADMKGMDLQAVLRMIEQWKARQ